MHWFLIYEAIIIACLAACQLNKQYLPTYYVYFQYLFIFILIFETSGELLSYYGKNSNFLDHFYQPVEFTILSVIYRESVNSASFKRWIVYLIVSFWLIALFYSFAIEGILNENKFSFFLESFIIIFYSWRYIYQLYTEPPGKESLLANPFFWVVTANLFYYYGIYFYMGLNSFIKSKETRDSLRVINMSLNYALYILYLIGFLCKRIFRFTY